MKLKILQLNVWHGAFIDEIASFVKENDIDILHFQEVTGGKLATGGKYHLAEAKPHNTKNIGIDSFIEFKKRLSYEGELAVAWRLKNQPNSYFGVATLFKPNIEILEKKIIWQKPYKENDDYIKRDFAEDSKNSLALRMRSEDKIFWSINTHLAWGPDPKDEPYKLDQAKKLYDFVASLKELFILSGDFNLDPSSKVVDWFSKISRNLTIENGVLNTLNPRTHHVKRIFPLGITVDYIFVEPKIEVINFELIDKLDLSDHFGLLTEIEV